MPEERPAKIIWDARVTKKKKRGRSQKTWDDKIEDILTRYPINVQKARKTAKNSKEWKDVINKIA